MQPSPLCLQHWWKTESCQEYQSPSSQGDLESLDGISVAFCPLPCASHAYCLRGWYCYPSFADKGTEVWRNWEMCASGRVAMKSGRSASRAELFTMGVCCFDAVRASSVGFSKMQGLTCTDCKLKAGQRFADVYHSGMGWGPWSAKESSNGSPLFPKPIPGGWFQMHILLEVSRQGLSFPGWGSPPKQQNYRQSSNHPGDAGTVSPYFPDEDTEIRQRPSFGW